MDRKLVILPNEWLKPIIERYPAMEKEYRRLELAKNGNTERQKDAFAFLRPFVRGLVDAVGTRIREHMSYIFIPNLKEKVMVLSP